MKVQDMTEVPKNHNLPNPRLNKSQEDEKAHKLAVVGGFLTGIGIFLVLASIAMTFMVAPLLLGATIPFGLCAIVGCALLGHSQSARNKINEAQKNLPPFIPGQPIGLVNAGGNDCWLNSLMQIAVVFPEVGELFQDIENFDKFTNEYRKSQKNPQYNPSKQSYVASNDVENLRKGIAKKLPHFVSADSEQVDLPTVLGCLINSVKKSKLDYKMRAEITKEIYLVSDDSRVQNRSVTQEHESKNLINLHMPDIPRTDANEEESSLAVPSDFRTYLSAALSDESITNPEANERGVLEKAKVSKKYYFDKSPPQTLLFNVVRTRNYKNQHGEWCTSEREESFYMPESFSLPLEHIQGSKESPNYNCHAFITGGGIHHGHYTACIQTNGKYYFINDEKVCPISKEEYAEKRNFALLYFYKQEILN